MARKKKKKVIHFTSIDELVSLRQSRNVNDLIDEKLPIGDKVADALAGFVGSWGFIIVFVLSVFAWIMLNSAQLANNLFDPFPFILLNLILSLIAAFQAPIIMMSQNRVEDKDRIRSEHEYKVNLKSEILIEEILLRLDAIEEQNKRLIEHIKREEKMKKNLENNDK